MIKLYFKTQEENDEVVFLEYIPGEKSGEYAIRHIEESVVTSNVSGGIGILYETQDAMEAAVPFIQLRQSAYPTIAEQLDKLYHDMTVDKGNKTGTWYTAIKAVKDAIPKS
jgi:hypothetical protein